MSASAALRAAAQPGCRGTVSLYALRAHGRHSGRVRFTIRAGATRRFPIRLTKSAYAEIVREEAKKDGEAVVSVVATTIDQAGTRSREDSWFEVDLRREKRLRAPRHSSTIR